MLEIVVFDPILRKTPKENKYFDQCYEKWKEIWNEEYLRLDSAHQWSSDTFTRQEAILAIFYEKRFAASLLYRPVNLKSVVDRDDSFFTSWPEDVLNKLSLTDPDVTVYTSFTVAKEFRKTEIEGYNMKDILGAAMVYYFKQSGQKILLGISRNSRKVNQYVFNWGCESLGTISFKGEPSDLIICRADRQIALPPNLEQLFKKALVKDVRNNHLTLAPKAA